MGSPPPRDEPPPEEQAAIEADAGFEDSPSGATLCGFGIPLFRFSFAFRIPGFPFALPLPFSFGLALNCDLSDPIEASFAFGGGRVSTGPSPDDDPEFGPD